MRRSSASSGVFSCGPLINRDEDRLVYIRQNAPGIGVENAAFSVPEIRGFRERVKSVTAFGEFSTIDFTMVGLGEPRVVRAGVVDGLYFDVMGLRPVLGRLLGSADDGSQAAGAVVITHRFWTTALQSDESVIGKTVRLGDRSVTIVGVLEPSIPYPAQTEIIANVVTSPHHMSATMEEGRVHRMTELFGPARPWRRARSGPGRAARRPWRHPERISGGLSRGSRLSNRRRGACAIRSPLRREPYFSCSLPRRRSSSSSRARTWRT